MAPSDQGRGSRSSARPPPGLPAGGAATIPIVPLPDPALVVLIGAAGSGKSTWALDRYRRAEVVSSDDLRGIVGSGPADLDASADAFDLLERIVAARLSRGLTTVVDTLGLDADRRIAWRDAARAAGLPAVAVLLDTPADECRRRNALRDRPVPAPALAEQVRRSSATRAAPRRRGLGPRRGRVRRGAARRCDAVRTSAPAEGAAPDRSADPRPPTGCGWCCSCPGSPGARTRVRGCARWRWRRDEAGFAGLALMDHLIQIPQVDTAWQPIPEPWVTLGLVAGLDTRLELGTLCTPVTFRPAGVTAKAAATLDALSGGRAFLGIGAGWWEREHAAYGLPFPAAAERLDLARGDDRDLPRALGARHQGVRRGRGSPARDHVVPATGPRHPGHRRRQRRAPHAGDRRPARRRVQPAVRRGRARPTSSRCSTGTCASRPHPRRRGRHGARPAGRRARPRRRLGAGRAAAWPHAAAAFARRTHAGTVDQQRDRLRRAARARREHRVRRGPRPRRSRRGPRLAGLNQ